MRGLNPASKLTLFMLRNNLLPSQEQLHHFGKADNPRCLMSGAMGGYSHFLVCDQLSHSTLPLWTVLEKLALGLSLEQVVNCEIVGDEETVFAVT